MQGRGTASEPREGASREAERAAMVEALRGEIRDERVLDAMARVPREVFVPERLHGSAYENRPLPIGGGQTISQPLMVGVMLAAARLRGDERALDVGAGSGYQAALLAELCREVHAIEILPDLVASARRALEKVGATNVTLVQGDGRQGHAPGAPYDAIFVAAAAQDVPQPLIDQLAEGGRLLIPLGGHFGQTLTRVEKRDGEIRREQLDACAFVPLVDER